MRYGFTKLKQLSFIQSVNLYRIFLLLFFLPFMISISGCKKNLQNNDEYYVKYEVNSNTIYGGRELNVRFKKEDDQFSTLKVGANSQWEITIGPVKKGFVASINASEIMTNYGHLTLSSKISVSKNGSPFATKYFDDDTAPRTAISLVYAIDY